MIDRTFFDTDKYIAYIKALQEDPLILELREQQKMILQRRTKIFVLVANDFEYRFDDETHAAIGKIEQLILERGIQIYNNFRK